MPFRVPMISVTAFRDPQRAFNHQCTWYEGAGKAGAIGSTPATLNALTDALYRAYGVRHIEMPATPSRIWATIRDAVAE